MTGARPKLAIATSFAVTYRNYISACEELGVPYEIFDILSEDWMSFVMSSDCDGYLLRPPCDIPERKAAYDERVYFLHKVLGKPIYPGFEELYLYENKRNMSYWLQAHGFPHPRTRVFLRKDEALQHLSQREYPVVLKGNTGSGARRVSIVRSPFMAGLIARRVFGFFHPLATLGYPPSSRVGKRTVPWPQYGVAQKHCLLVQDFKEIRWEWRLIKIGDSYFGHKKLLSGKFASGSDSVGWEPPPVELLDLVRRVTETGGFHSMALDVFETVDGEYLINEIQSLFGSIIESQMFIDGVPGRFRRVDGEYVFEEGTFNRHGSYLLRVEHFLELLARGPDRGRTVG